MASELRGAVHDPLPQIQEPVGLPNNALLPLHLWLDRANYSYWRALVLAAGRAYNIEGHLLGSSPCSVTYSSW